MRLEKVQEALNLSQRTRRLLRLARMEWLRHYVRVRQKSLQELITGKKPE